MIISRGTEKAFRQNPAHIYDDKRGRGTSEKIRNRKEYL